VVNGVLLRPLPWKDSDRLVAVWVARPQWRNQQALAAYWNRGDLSRPMFEGLREKRRTLADIGTYDESQLILGALGAPVAPAASEAPGIGRLTERRTLTARKVKRRTRGTNSSTACRSLRRFFPCSARGRSSGDSSLPRKTPPLPTP
jgi:hypothetical protein